MADRPATAAGRRFLAVLARETWATEERETFALERILAIEAEAAEQPAPLDVERLARILSAPELLMEVPIDRSGKESTPIVWAASNHWHFTPLLFARAIAAAYAAATTDEEGQTDAD